MKSTCILTCLLGIGNEDMHHFALSGHHLTMQGWIYHCHLAWQILKLCRMRQSIYPWRHDFSPYDGPRRYPPATISPQSLPVQHLPIFSCRLGCFPSIIPVPSPHVDCLVPLPPTPASLSPSHSRRPGNATSKCNTTVWVSSLPFPRVVHGLAGNVGNMLMTCLRPATCQNVANFFSDMPIPATRFSCVGTL